MHCFIFVKKLNCQYLYVDKLQTNIPSPVLSFLFILIFLLFRVCVCVCVLLESQA
jgi:hypothetical protein